MKKQNYLNWNYNILKSALRKINSNIILIIILDFLFYIISGYFIIFWITRISEKVNSFNLPADLASIGIERMQQLSKETQSFYYLVVFSFMILLIAVIFLASILKGVIWAKTTNKKINLSLFSRFLWLNLIWLGFWFVLIFLISWIVDIKYAPAFMTIAILTGFYLTNTFYTMFMLNPTIKSIKWLKLNITKIHLFLLPYFIIFIGFFLVMLLSSLVQLDNFSFLLAQKIYGFLGFSFAATDALGLLMAPQPGLSIALLVGILANPLLLLFVSLARYYVSTLVYEISKIAKLQ